MDDIDKAMAAHIEATLKLADDILDSAGADAHDAILKAVGTLAQVIFITVHDSDREYMIDQATDKLRNYVNLLEELRGMGVLIESQTH